MIKDVQYMRRALTLAKRAYGRTSPNPMVGAVLVKKGRIVGEGWHKKAGTEHAEINAIAAAGKKTVGSTLYVTLEPCSTTGKTPPCTEAIKSAKIAKVVIGCLDQNPIHSGKALKILEKAGIETVINVEKEKCRELNESFFHWVNTGMPFIILKMAMTLDGKTATEKGESKWITGPEARKSVQKLRKWADAIMVGGETVRKDSPSLNVRNDKGSPIEKWVQPQRIVASNKLTQEQAAKMMGDGKTPVIIKAETPQKWEKELKKLGKGGITALLVEGGSELASSLLNAGVLNRAVFYIAPKILGGKESRPVIGGINPLSLTEAYDLQDIRVSKVGVDIRVEGRII